MCCFLCAENVKIDVSASLRLPESSHKSLPAADAGDRTDSSQHNTTDDASSSGTAEAVTCNGNEIKVYITNGDKSSEEAGGM